VKIAPELQRLVVAHARRDAPNECCGIVGLRDDVATEVIAFANLAASPYRFEIEGLSLSRELDRLEDDGQDFAIYHSHTRSEPYPSQTDLNFAANWPGVEWLIVGVAGGPEADAVLRSYRIDDGVVTEVGVG
jgi:proteasome lid subunit RPN8/RPN11